MKRELRSIVWLGVGLGLLGWVVYRAGWATTLGAFSSALARPWLVTGAVGLFVATQTGFLVKWHLMSRRAGADVGWRESMRLFGTLCLVGTFTPGRAGELAVPLLMRGGGRLTGLALVNRLLESLWTLLAGVLALFFLFQDDPWSGRFWVVGSVVAVFVGTLVVLSRRRLTAGLLGGVGRCLARFQGFRPVARLVRLQERYAEGIERFYEANQRLLRLWPLLIFGALMAGIWIMMVTANYLLIRAVVPPGESQITYAAVFAVMVVSAVVMFLSPIPGGVGLSEFTAVALFRHLGHAQPELVTFLLLSRLILYAGVVGLYVAGRLGGRELPQAAGGAAPSRDDGPPR